MSEKVKQEKQETKQEAKQEAKQEVKQEVKAGDVVLRGRVVGRADRVVENVELRRRADGHWYTPDGREAAIVARIGDAEGEVR